MAVIQGNFLVSSGIPDDVEDGVDNDHCRDIVANVLYFKAAGEWSVVGNFNAPADEVGTIWLTGDEIPEPEIGEDGNYYRKTPEQTVYEKSQGSWIFAGDMLDNLDPTPTRVFSVSDTPNPELGIDGDTAITTSGFVWQKVESTWVGRGQLGGAVVVDNLTYGNVVPTDEIGENGQFYLDLTTNILYHKNTDNEPGAFWTAQATLGTAPAPLEFNVNPWDMGGTPVAVDLVDAYQGTVGGISPNMTLTPNSVLTVQAASSQYVVIGSSPIGIPKAGVGTRSAKLIYPAWVGGDTLSGLGIALVNSSATNEDIAQLVTDGTPTNPTYGKAIHFATNTGAADLATFNGTTSSFGTPVVLSQEAGDAIYLTYNSATGEASLQMNTGTLHTMGVIDWASSPDDTLKVVAYLISANATVIFGAEAMVVSAGTDDDGKLPFAATPEATPPEGAIDGSVYEVTVAGVFGNKETKVNDYVQLYDSVSKIIITRVEHDVDAEGGGGSGGTYRGTVDLTPTYNAVDAVVDTFVGCTGVSDVDGICTITPAGTLATVGDGVFAAIATSTEVFYDPDLAPGDLKTASFVMPDLTLDALGYLFIAIHDNAITGEQAVQRLMGINSLDTQISAIGLAYNAGVEFVRQSLLVNGTGAATTATLGAMPVAGTIYNLTMDVDGVMGLTDGASYNEVLATFPVSTIAFGDRIAITLGYVTTGSTTDIASFILDAGDASTANLPFTQATLIPATLPVGTVDGDYVGVTGAGPYGTQTASVGDVLTLISSLADCIVTPGDVHINALIAASVGSGGVVNTFVGAEIAALAVVGDWDASATAVAYSNLVPAVYCSVASSTAVKDVIEPTALTGLTAFPYAAGQYHYGVQQTGITPANWHVDFDMPDLTPDAGASRFHFEARNTSGTFYATSGLRGVLQVVYGTADHTFLKGKRCRIRINTSLNRIELFVLTSEFEVVDYNTPYTFSTFTGGSVATSNVKAAMSYVSGSSSTVVTGFNLYNKLYEVTLPVGVADGKTYRVATSTPTVSWFNGGELTNGDFVKFYSSTTKVVTTRVFDQAKVIAALQTPTGTDELLTVIEIGRENVTYANSGAVNISPISEYYAAVLSGEESVLFNNIAFSLADGTTKASFDVKFTYETGLEGDPKLFNGEHIINMLFDCSDVGSGAGAITVINLVPVPGSDPSILGGATPTLSVPSGKKLWVSVVLRGVRPDSVGGNPQWTLLGTHLEP